MRRARSRAVWAVGRAAGLAVAVTLVAVAAGAETSSSLEGRYFHRNWRRADGLPGNSVYAIAQSVDGYLWVGTENGLARFDGRHFVVVGGPGDAFRCRMVEALAADPDGTLWIGTERGLLHLRDGQLVRDGAPGSEVAAAAVGALALDAGGDLWIGTRSGLLRRLAESGDVTAAGLAGLRITHLLAGEPGEVWAGTATAGAWHLRDGKLTPVGGGPGPAGRRVTGLVRGAGGDVLVFDSGAEHDGRARHAALGRRGGVLAAAGGGNNLWLATAEQGLIQVGPRQSWSAVPGGVLASTLVSTFFFAADRSVWLGSAGDGLHQLVAKSCQTWSHLDGLASDRSEAVLIDAGEVVWVGTSRGLTRLARHPDGSVSAQPALGGFEVSSILRDHQGRLWLGTDDGLRQLSGGRWQAVPLWDRARFAVNTLYEDRSHNLWFGTPGGLGTMAAGRGAITRVPGLSGLDVTGLAEAGDGALWIGTRGAGLLRLAAGQLTVLRSAEELPIVTAVRGGRAGEMWVGSFDRGLLHWSGGRWHLLDDSNGLADNSIRQVIEDRGGDLWICSSTGIARLGRQSIDDLEAGRVAAAIRASYGPEDGIAEGVCYGFAHPGVGRTADGHLWFATSHGLVEVRPERMAEAPPLGAPPQLDEAAIDGRLLALALPATPLTVPAGAQRLELRPSLPLFAGRARMAMRCRLADFDREWIDPCGERRAHYTNLPPGTYHFQAEVREPSGDWSRPTDLRVIEVEPRLDQRQSARALAAFAPAGLAALLYLGLQRRLRRRAAAMEEVVRQRTEELRQANDRLAALATSDPLTGLANRRRLQEAMETELRRASRSRQEVSLILFDVDCFKGYNDTLGHLAGDDCLRQVAGVLAGAASRAGDLAARYGGEELALLLPGTPARQALRIAETVRQQIQQLGLANPGSTVAPEVTVSGGVAGVLPDASFTPAGLIAQADAALYSAKHGGRNQVQLAVRTAVASLPAAVPRAVGVAGVIKPAA
jgi:diguanylate cyclase (GGDEF)-like protein